MDDQNVRPADAPEVASDCGDWLADLILCDAALRRHAEAVGAPFIHLTPEAPDGWYTATVKFKREGTVAVELRDLRVSAADAPE